MAELLIHVDRILNTDPKAFRDGDVILAFRDFKISYTWAQMIVRGTTGLDFPVFPKLAVLLAEITEGGKHKPLARDLETWWTEVERLGIDRHRCRRWPFGRLERKKYLVVKLDADITMEQARDLSRPEIRWASKPITEERDAPEAMQMELVQKRRRYLSWRPRLTPEQTARVLDLNVTPDFVSEIAVIIARTDVIERTPMSIGGVG